MPGLRITAILTTHRRPGPMLRALASITAERRRPDEILVVEDGADPGMPERLRATGIPCRLLSRPLSSVAKARNLGLREARGDWVIYLDDDDVAYPNRLEELEAAALEGCPAFVYGSTLMVKSGERIPVPTHHPGADGAAGFQDILVCMPHTNSILFSRQALLDSGGFVEASSYFSDWCALLHILDRAPKASPARRVGSLLAEFRVGDEGMTHEVARDRSMRAKILEAFANLRLERTEHLELVGRMRSAVEAAGVITDYSHYAQVASGTLQTLQPF